jgi:lysozyme
MREVRGFIDAVERRTGHRIVVYAYPDFVSRYRIADALDRRRWVRRIGASPPAGDWWIWPRDDQARIDGQADPNLMRP